MKKIAYIILSIILLSTISCDEELLNPNSNDPRENIEGDWHCVEDSPTYGQTQYSVYISLDIDSSKVLIDNFYQIDNDISALVVFDDPNLTIEQQTLPGGFVISGQGSVSDNYKTIELSYTVEEIPVKSSENTLIETVTAVYTKK
ncbi:MAG: hypothetical protein HOB05_01990 [Bacteroidetes bacterium]|nr:hypothetical protein [Bacteroidota bacterium]MBT7144565.1 hypothetical protein [Bacteroidota bacterium]